jgi:hypothetical protein
MVNKMKKATELTLEYVHKQFQLWRQTKSAGRKIPEDLWGLVKRLLETNHCNKTTVCKTLSISTRQLKDKFPELYSQKSTKENFAENLKPKAFVRAPLTPILDSAVPKLTIDRGDGCKLFISMPSSQQLSAIIQAFME